MPTCSHCDHDVGSSATFCPNCGERGENWKNYPSLPSSPTERAWGSLVSGPILVLLFGAVAFVVAVIGLYVVVWIIGVFTSSKVNWQSVDTISPWFATISSLGAMFWLVNLELGGMHGIKAYLKSIPSDAELLFRGFISLLFRLAIFCAIGFVLYAIIKNVFLK